MNNCHHGERGQAVPLMAAVLAIALAAVVALGHLGRQAADLARARTAADAAALAGAIGGRLAAVELAGANGAELVSFREEGGAVRVTVAVGEALATARAAMLVADDTGRREGRAPP